MPTKPDKVLPSLYGGIIIAVLSSIPGLNLINVCCCCALVMVGGVMAVYFYKNTLTPESAPIESSDGVQLGLLAGVFGAILVTLISVIIQLLFGNIGSKLVMDFLERFAETGNVPPEIMDKIHQEIERSMTGELRFIQIVKEFLINLVIYPTFGLFGGLIGVSLFKPKRPPVIQIPPPPAVPMA